MTVLQVVVWMLAIVGVAWLSYAGAGLLDRDDPAQTADRAPRVRSVGTADLGGRRSPPRPTRSGALPPRSAGPMWPA